MNGLKGQPLKRPNSHCRLHAEIVCQFSASSSVWKFQMRPGVIFRSSADPPLEVVSGLYYWWTEPVWMDKSAVQNVDVSVWQSDNCTGPSLNLIKRNFPQSNVTCPNNSNVVTVFNFVSLYEEKNTTAVGGEASILLSVLPIVLPTHRHISARKTASVIGKKL